MMWDLLSTDSRSLCLNDCNFQDNQHPNYPQLTIVHWLCAIEMLRKTNAQTQHTNDHRGYGHGLKGRDKNTSNRVAGRSLALIFIIRRLFQFGIDDTANVKLALLGGGFVFVLCLVLILNIIT